MDWIQIFKIGAHTDSNGNTRTWTEKELDGIVESYNPANHEAPAVIGHPKDNAPAWGWVEGLKRDGQFLYAKFKDLIPEFVDMVKKGMFKKRSISLYPDGTLRHIGFLGAMPPAVKGLADIVFEDEGGTVIEFEEPPHPALSHEGRGHKEGTIIRKEEKHMKFFEWLKGLAAKEGVTLEDMPQTFNEPDIQAKIDAALKKQEAEFSEKVASLDEARKKKDAELKAREDALKAKEAEGKKQAIASFCEGLAKEGKIIPAMFKLGMGLQNFLEKVSEIHAVVDFGEGAEKKSQTPLDFMQSFLKSLPKAIEFGEVAGNDKDAGKYGNADKRKKLVSDFMENNKGASYKEAVVAVLKKHPELREEE